MKDALRFIDALGVAAIELLGCVGRYLGQIPWLNLVRDNMRVVELYGFGQQIERRDVHAVVFIKMCDEFVPVETYPLDELLELIRSELEVCQ